MAHTFIYCSLQFVQQIVIMNFERIYIMRAESECFKISLQFIQTVITFKWCAKLKNMGITLKDMQSPIFYTQFKFTISYYECFKNILKHESGIKMDNLLSFALFFLLNIFSSFPTIIPLPLLNIYICLINVLKQNLD